jgi:ferrous iron transport protein A
MKNKKVLSEMAEGQHGIIDSITDSKVSLKLLEMGCVPGEEVKIENIAPLGDPIAIMVSGYKLSLRKDEAHNIIVLTGK